MTTKEAKDRSVSEHSHSLRQRDTIHLQDKATSIGEKGSANVGSICPLDSGQAFNMNSFEKPKRKVKG